MPKQTGRIYGWKRDLPDRRDKKFKLLAFPDHFPLKIDLSENLPDVYDQGPLGSCTANAICAAYQFDRNKSSQPSYTPSRLFLYYNERAMEYSANYDSGATIRDGIKSLASDGITDEVCWPYVISRFNTKPPKACYDSALIHKAINYEAVPPSVFGLKVALLKGYPVVIGFTVYESFETHAVSTTGIVPMPGPEERTLGGHAVLAVGYDDTTGTIKVRNSWGPNWGDKGNFHLPYSYITSELTADYWTLEVVS